MHGSCRSAEARDVSFGNPGPATCYWVTVTPPDAPTTILARARIELAPALRHQ